MEKYNINDIKNPVLKDILGQYCDKDGFIYDSGDDWGRSYYSEHSDWPHVDGTMWCRKLHRTCHYDNYMSGKNNPECPMDCND